MKKIMIPFILFLMFTMFLPISTTNKVEGIMVEGIVEVNGKKVSVYDAYFKNTFDEFQKEHDVVVPFSWIYATHWIDEFDDFDKIDPNKTLLFLDEAVSCDEEKCGLVTVEEYINNVSKKYEINKEELKDLIQDITEVDTIFLGEVPEDLSQFKDIEIGDPLDKNSYYVSATFGYYDPKNTGDLIKHSGTDLAPIDGKSGHPLLSMIDGVVSAKGYDANGWGNWILIQSTEHPHFSIRFAHMVKPTQLIIGAEVERGDVIGYLGNTGFSTGNHLHIEFLANNERFNAELLFNFE